MQDEAPLEPLEIALSGGGTRAMAFHAGVLRFMASQRALERVRHVSTVSGGSLLMGLLFHRSEMRWPTSPHYLAKTLPAIRQDLTGCSLSGRALARLMMPWNWRFLLSRANLVAKTIESCWGITATLEQLPSSPEWSINGTTAETGRRFRFKTGKIGDYELGYAEAKGFRLAKALAVSAAFPGGIGPLAIDTADYQWRKLPSWGATQALEQVVEIPYKRLHLYDGGVYDNLGLEPLFDTGLRIPKTSGATLIVSDAGAPLTQGFSLGELNPWRLKRLLDIAGEQQRALRVRVFVRALQSGVHGAYLQIGSSASEQLARATEPVRSDLTWLSTAQAKTAASLATSLGRLTQANFDLIERHGYETARWNDQLYSYLQNRSASS